MTGSDGNAVAGGPARHIPVLGRRTVEWLGVRDGGLYVDATFGAGGYTQAILATPGARVIGIDRDQSAIAAGFSLVEAAQGRLDLHSRRGELDLPDVAKRVLVAGGGEELATGIVQANSALHAFELAAAAGFDLPDLVARGAWLVAKRAFGETDCELETIVVGRDGRVLARRRS